jgi:hypothetical protein
MPRKSTERARALHPAASAQIEGKLAARQVTFAFEPNLQIDRIREVDGIQVRLLENRAPTGMVARYAQQMKGGAIFPAIVINDRYELIDGNTRWMAARRNQRPTLAAYVCSALSALQARSLSVELNQSHGVAMTEEEIHAFLVGAVEGGQVLDIKAYSRITGVRPSTLSRWLAAERFRMRAHRDGISVDRLDGLSLTVRAALQVARLRSVFIAATTLALDAKVPAAQLNAIIAAANAAPSEAEALAVIGDAREIRSHQIAALAAGCKGGRRRSAAAALHIGGLLRLQVTDLLDVVPDKQDERLGRMIGLRQRLDGALARARVEWNLDQFEVPNGRVESSTDHLAEVR